MNTSDDGWEDQTSGLTHFVTPGTVDVSHGPILYLEDVTVSFDGFKALNKLHLTIDAGELRCIIGPNGAGKTTMMDVITGKTRPDTGQVYFGQTIDLTKLTEPEIAHAGIGRKFQKPTVLERHTVFPTVLYIGTSAKLDSQNARTSQPGQPGTDVTVYLDTVQEGVGTVTAVLYTGVPSNTVVVTADPQAPPVAAGK